MDNPYAAPGAAQADESMGVDDVQLRRDNPHPNPAEGVFTQAWQRVKSRPVETILLALLSTIFGNGRCGVQLPTNFSDLGGTGGYDDSSDYDWGGEGGGYDDPYEYITNVDLQTMIDWVPGAEMLGLPSMVGQLGGAEIGIMVFAVLLIFAIAAAVFVVGVALQAAEDIYWLRVVRGQHEDLGKSFSVLKYMIPIMVAQVLVAIGSTLGLLLLIVPGVILSLGWIFVGLVAVDKNLGYVDAVKASWRLTSGYKLDIFVMVIISILISIAGLLACCVGVVVAYAVIQGAFVIFYDRIAEPGNSYLQQGESTGTGGFGSSGGASHYGGPNQGGPNYGGPNQGGPNQGGPNQGGPNQGGPTAAGESSPDPDDPYGTDPYGAEW